MSIRRWDEEKRQALNWAKDNVEKWPVFGETVPSVLDGWEWSTYELFRGMHYYYLMNKKSFTCISEPLWEKYCAGCILDVIN